MRDCYGSKILISNGYSHHKFSIDPIFLSNRYTSRKENYTLNNFTMFNKVVISFLKLTSISTIFIFFIF